jgi:dienelactone hydrolase
MHASTALGLRMKPRPQWRAHATIGFRLLHQFQAKAALIIRSFRRQAGEGMAGFRGLSLAGSATAQVLTSLFHRSVRKRYQTIRIPSLKESMRKTLAVFITLALLAAVGYEGYRQLALGGAFVEKRPPEALLAMLIPDITIRRPEGSGPYPAILLYHGCLGLWREQDRLRLIDSYADIAVSEGVVAVIVDSLRPRQIDYLTALNEVCEGDLLRGAERAGDVAVTVSYARSLPYVDPTRLAIAGWSHGGWAVMDFLAMSPEQATPHNLTHWPDDPFAGIVGVYLTYPYCGFPALVREQGFEMPWVTWAIHGTNDATADPAECDEAYALARKRGSTVDVARIEGATHAFDDPDLDPAFIAKYDAAFAEVGHDRFRSFLRQVLVNPKP